LHSSPSPSLSAHPRMSAMGRRQTLLVCNS
jgi:hypothetical protein